MTAKIGSLNVDVTMETARFKDGARKLQDETGKLEGRFGKLKLAGASLAGGLAGLGAGIVIGGLQSAVSGAFELASSMSEAASRVGVTVEALQELRVAANANGLSNEQLESSMARLNIQLGDLQNGAGPATKAFAAIGLSAEQLKGLKPDEALGLIADKIAAIKDPALQAAAAQDIFGKSYAAMLPLLKGGKEAFDEAAEASRRQGQLSTEDAQKLDDLADTWDRLKTRVGIATATLIANLSGMAEQVGAFFDRINAKAAAIDAAIAQFVNNAVASVQRLYTGIKTWLSDKLNAIWDGFLDRVERARKATSNLFTRSNFQSASFDGQGGFGFASFMKMGEVANDNADETEAANVRIVESFKDMADKTLSALSTLSGAIRGGGFLDILQSVIGLGLQLGSAGLFGKGVAARINAPAIPTGGTSGLRNKATGGSKIEVTPSPYFNVVVDGRVQQAAPQIVMASAQASSQSMAFQRSRRLA